MYVEYPSTVVRSARNRKYEVPSTKLAEASLNVTTCHPLGGSHCWTVQYFPLGASCPLKEIMFAGPRFTSYPAPSTASSIAEGRSFPVPVISTTRPSTSAYTDTVFPDAASLPSVTHTTQTAKVTTASITAINLVSILISIIPLRVESSA